MSNKRARPLITTISCLLVAGPWIQAYADDTEIFNVTATTSSSPNVLFILDTSGSMTTHVYARAKYDPNTTYDSSYTHSCDPTLIYYVTGGTNTPTCGTAATSRRAEVPASPSFAKTVLKCEAAKDALWNTSSATGTYGGNGIGDNAIRWIQVATTVSSSATPVSTTRSRSITNSRTQTVVTTQVYRITGTKINSGTETFNTPTAQGSATTVSDTTSTPTSSTGSWGTSTSTPTGSATTTNTSTSSQSWSTALTVPANSTTTSTSSTNTGSTTTSTTTGSWTNGSSSSSYSDGTRTTISTSTSSSSSGGMGMGSTTTTTTTVYEFTRTTTTTTPATRVDTETQSTPATSSSITTTTTYTGTDIECDGDRTNGSSSLGYPNNVAPTSTQWTSNKPNSWWETGGGLQQYTFYSGNYLNYLVTAPTTDEGTRISVMQDAISGLVDTLSGVNVGLMRYDAQANGGMVTYAMTPIASGSSDIKNIVNSYTANGNTPLSETMYEAYLYYSGSAVNYGNTSTIYDSSSRSYVASKSVAASRTGGVSTSNTYQTPIANQCQSNYIVYLTDGLPTADTGASSAIRALPSFSTYGGTCNSTTADGGCLSALSQYMYRADLNSSLSGSQGVASYFIGFGDDFSGTGGATAFEYLQDAARRGGGQAYSASDSAELTTKIGSILQDIAARDTSFAAPGVAVNAFNKTQTLDDLFVSVFRPSITKHWAGNVKKYHVRDGQIVDQTGAPAVDTATGFFTHSALSYWTTGDPDGANTQLTTGSGDGDVVPAGGAAHKLPAWGSRKVYTYISSATRPSAAVDLTNPANSFATTNTSITGSLLGDSSLTSSQLANLINWARGQDTNDADNPNSITTDTRSVMGAPIHSRPAVVTYGGTSTNPDTVVFATTNDGYLHAFGGKDSDGVELWSFIPQELLPSIKSLYDNSAATSTHYGLDGDLVVAKYDANGNGVVDQPDDKVMLYFSQGRGGQHYYALDITDKNAPKFVWSLGPSELPGIGQTWSTPALTRVNVSGATQNNQKVVLVFGGGYDSTEESSGYRNSNSLGNRVFMVDALYGTVLWSAGSSGANLNISRMDHAIPSNITVMDLDGNGYADRMYVGDMAGQVFRFDINNGQAAANLVTGGVIASLGTHDDTTHTDQNNRRFYNAPDAALVSPAGQSIYLNIAIGSGYRGHPLDTTIRDRFYSIKDKAPFTKYTQSQYNTIMSNSYSASTTNGVLHDSDLTDITTINTTVPAASPGWKLMLDDPSWQGEKVLSSSVTFSNKLLFTTYIPATSSSSTSTGCGTSSTGTNRAYAISVFDGAPVKEQGSDFTQQCTAGSCTANDRFDTLAQGGIASGYVILFPSTESSSSSSSSSNSSNSSGSSSSASSSSSNSSGSSGSSGSSSSAGNGSSSSMSGSCLVNGNLVPCDRDDDDDHPICLVNNESVACPSSRGIVKTYWQEVKSN